MQTSKGFLILTALSPTADEPQLIAYLEKRAKSIPRGRIPALLHNLPVVLSRNVAEETSMLVIDKLNELGAEARFVPLPGDGAPDTPLPEPGEPAAPAERGRIKLPFALPSKLAVKLPAQPWRSGPLTDHSLKQIGKTLLIVVAMLGIAWTLNYVVAPPSSLLSVFTLPAVVAAYFFGRNWALFAACAGIFLIGLGNDCPWLHLLSWGCVLLATAFAMGTLYEKNQSKAKELRQTYQGLLLILRHVTTHDVERENHCFRVSIYATRIADYLGLDKNSIEDIRTAALLHHLGRMQLSRSILRKASAQWLVQDEASGERAATDGDAIDERLLSGPVGRVLPLLLGQQKTAQQDQETESGEIAPLGSRILAVADAYDSLTFGNDGQPAVSPAEARDIVVAKAGTEFDPEVVTAFATAFERMEMELPTFIL
ncbi:MAG: HD domain-containing protein [Desulfobulbus sp.]|uniref:HD domain-containing phosphohydrolase n=1 Tax=Desulfobulbus sp. TaxID=895 RepID=UPI002848DA2B|nr:HD domain-containing phosphohydrolase [Desulfobulbus sp.]MDR2549681.1 HD domain-containing protein [Desulfobulbus sp.]